MAQYTNGPSKTFTAGEDLEAWRRVRLNASGNVIYADAEHGHIGVTEKKVSSGAQVPVRLRILPCRVSVSRSPR